MKILLIEDNETIIKGLKYYFEQNSYNLLSKTTIKGAAKFINNNLNIDLIILDVTLPDGNGFDFYKDFIKKLNIPVIFLTAKDNESDIVKGLDMGGEDYITKPFSTKELLARVNRVLRKNKKENIVKIDYLSFDFDKLKLYKEDEEIYLTPLELKILTLLLLNINKTISRNIIIDKIWEWTGNYVDDHTVTVYFNRIRNKIGVGIIKTVKGAGYRIDEE